MITILYVTLLNKYGIGALHVLCQQFKRIMEEYPVLCYEL